MEKKKVVVGMSGGVDSSVAAYLLKEQGYDVVGVTMQTWQPDCGYNQGTAEEDAKRVADQLGIPFFVVDFQKEFKESVIEYFIAEYCAGRTPNPCIVCNRYVKWEALLQYAGKVGADYIATGHYAKVEQLSNGRYTIKRAAFDEKDQTYALYGLTQKQLSYTLFPAGEYKKTQIREIAEKIGLKVAKKPDSQEICFVPDQDYAGFIERKMGKSKGNFIPEDGQVLGQHKGIIHYTIGQRKGLNLALGYPAYVLAILPETNEVVIGDGSRLFSEYVYADRINWMAQEDIEDGIRVVGKIRYNHKGASCRIFKRENGKLECIFDEPQRAATPGQALVLYQEDCVLGGGIIIGTGCK